MISSYSLYSFCPEWWPSWIYHVGMSQQSRFVILMLTITKSQNLLSLVAQTAPVTKESQLFTLYLRLGVKNSSQIAYELPLAIYCMALPWIKREYWISISKFSVWFLKNYGFTNTQAEIKSVSRKTYHAWNFYIMYFFVRTSPTAYTIYDRSTRDTISRITR